MTLGYLIRLSRPRFWLYLAGPVLVGLAWGAPSLATFTTWRPWALVAYFLVPANVFLYGVNDRFDAAIDETNPKKDGRETAWRDEPVATAAILASLAAGLALALLLDRAAWPWGLGFLVLGAAYSAPPLRFKTTPLLDSVSNGLYILPGVAAYVHVAEARPDLWIVAGAWAWTMAMHTFSAIPDIEPDRRAGIRTTATVLGEPGTLAYCAIVWTTAAGLVGLGEPLASLAFLAYPFLAAGVGLSSIPVEDAYWAFPAINALAGAGLTIGGLLVRFGLPAGGIPVG
jgi:4-hydroxybenzoate polyprenyltransferase